MADVALWSGATGAGNGTSWDDAYTSIRSLMVAQGTQPTRVFVASDHVELISTTLASPGTLVNPYTIISCDRTSGFPPTVEQAGARIGSTNGTNLTIQNSLYSKGVFWTAGEGSTATRNFLFDSSSGNHVIRIVGGGIELMNTGSGSRFSCGTGATNRNTKILLENAEIKFGNSGQGFSLQAASLNVKGGALAGAAITEFIKVASIVAADVDVTGFDMSVGASTMNLVASNILGIGHLKFSRVKMPVGWTGGLMASPPIHACLKVSAVNLDSANTNYRVMLAAYDGVMRQDTAILRTGGASDGTTPISWRLQTTVQRYPLTSFESLPIERWNESVGVPVTVTVHTLTDGVTLTDADAWIEVSYLDSSGSPLGAVISDEQPNQLSASAVQDSSTADWVTTGIASPVKQKLSVTFTPQKKGTIRVVIKLARSTTVIYACPQPDIT